jgi:NADPH-dependent 2,4-dienoyl-CoA reductase/sulfur reductase-like enzyme
VGAEQPARAASGVAVRSARPGAGSTADVAIVGAGPYGLAAAAHLRVLSGLDLVIFGKPMSFWETMPAGMLLRSNPDASYLGYPKGDLILPVFEAETGVTAGKPVPLEVFIDYGKWFQSIVAPDVDRRDVVQVSSAPGGFRVELDDGEVLRARRVVVAAGIAAFAARPPAFDHLPPELASHTSEHRDLAAFAGRSVAVVGGGQSALESAALLHERGAHVEVFARSDKITWLRGGTIHRKLGRAKRVFYAQTDVGPLGLSRVVAVPGVFRRLPRPVQEPLAYRSIRPAGARWLVSRLADVPLFTGRTVMAAAQEDGRLHVCLDDGTTRCVDHVMFGTGYRIDIARYGFLAPQLVEAIRTADGYPLLRRGLESSVRGLHFFGAPGAWSFGPILRFVSGSWFAASALRRTVASRSRV